ncbi:non-heme dioxygenase N-terminal domain-containing protein [Tanacetum coccineum]
MTSEGYGNDMVLSKNQTLDWTGRLNLTVLSQDQQRLQYWPQNPAHFRSLNLEEDCFLNQYGMAAKMQARFNYYPSCPWPENVLGVKPHADGLAITVFVTHPNWVAAE